MNSYMPAQAVSSAPERQRWFKPLYGRVKLTYLQIFLLLAFGNLLFIAYTNMEKSSPAYSSECSPYDCRAMAAVAAVQEDITDYLKKERLMDNRNGQLTKANATHPSSLKNHALEALGDTSQGQVPAILELLNYKKNGTFVEAGANDGITESNTLAPETLHGWNGLLIEPVPWLFDRLVTTGRRTLFLEGCVSPKPFPFIAEMTASKDRNHTIAQELATIDDSFRRNILRPEILRVDCFPLGNILAAAGLAAHKDHHDITPPLLDVLILDLQGPELLVLKSVLWSMVNIELLVIENNYEEPTKHQEHLEEMTKYLSSVSGGGYSVVRKVAKDYIFQRNQN